MLSLPHSMGLRSCGHEEWSCAQLELLESLAVGPGLGRVFAQAHSFSIVIWDKLSLPPAFREVGRRP